jgi:hypothetical protein
VPPGVWQVEKSLPESNYGRPGFSRERSREPASQLTSSLFLAKARREPSGTNLKMLQDARSGP